MKLVLVIVSLVTALAGCYTQAQHISNGPKTHSYVGEARKLLVEPETQYSAFVNKADDSNSLTEDKQARYFSEDQHIMEKHLVVIDDPNNFTYSEDDEMAMVHRASRWCRDRGGRCRSREFSCDNSKNQETPYGRPFCKRDFLRCCYPDPCRDIWCDKTNEECVNKNWATTGSCQCKDGYVRDKQNNCIDTTTTSAPTTITPPTTAVPDTTTTSAPTTITPPTTAVPGCSKGYDLIDGRCILLSRLVNLKDERYEDAKRYCIKDGGDLVSLGYTDSTYGDPVLTYIQSQGLLNSPTWVGATKTAAGPWEWADGRILDEESQLWLYDEPDSTDTHVFARANSANKRAYLYATRLLYNTYPFICEKPAGTCDIIWCEAANEECDDNAGTTAGSCQCADGYVRDKQNNCIGTCAVIWCDKANEKCDDNNGKTAGSCQCADGYVIDKQNNCNGTCAVIWCDKANEECDDNAGTTAGSCQCADGYVRDKQNNCAGTCDVIWCDKANEECEDNAGTTAGSCQCAGGYVRDKQNNCVGTCSVIWCDKADEECDDNKGTTAGSCQCADGYVRDKQNNCIVTTTTSIPTTTTTSTTRAQSATMISGCGGEYTSITGTIRHPSSSGNYQNNENCVWLLKPGLNTFEIRFIRFDTENNYDYLSVRNGAIIEGNFTGSSVPTSLVVTADTLTLLFTSDRSETRTGLEITWGPIFKIPA